MTDLQLRATTLLKRFYGYDTFRPQQMEIIEHTMAGGDSLVLMPTGGGKSVCFQLPALLNKGLTIVISPLIALMNDQVELLLANGIGAGAIHSNQSDTANRKIIDLVYHNRIKILYISPERLLLELDRWLSELNISLIAIDEAHCISQWGHDFRPEYSQLSTLRERFPNTPIMALTATADLSTREDILKQLNLKNPRQFISSFDRPNIEISVVQGARKAEKIRTITHLVRKYNNDPGIVYCMSRSATESMCKWLNEAGIPSVFYHAGLSSSERERAQQAFSTGEVTVICATVAFGMGINKGNIRWIVHNNLPQSIESYYQEIGRAGRDGLPAEAILFFSLSDLITREKFVNESGQKDLNKEKLERMRQFADAKVCRRRILLNYFNETTDHDCGNCDICKTPPERFDGTLQAQMALSAVKRTEGKASLSLLIDILRGNQNADISLRSYNKLKTFGVGRNISRRDWENYITQFIQLGLLNIHYSNDRRFIVTELGEKVLFKGEKVELAKIESFFNKRSDKNAESAKEKVDSHALLLSALKSTRASLAKKYGVPTDIIFPDVTLHHIAKEQPVNKEKFSNIQGVSERKAAQYWRPFVDTVRHHLGLSPLPDDTQRVSLITDMLTASGNPAEAAEKLGMPLSSLNEEIARFIDADMFNNFNLVISRSEFMDIMNLNRQLNEVEFRTEIKSKYPEGLDKIAMSMASYILRHR